MLALVATGAALLDVPLRFRHQTLHLGADTVVLALGLAFDRPGSVLVAIVLAELISTARRRSRPVKAAFNVLNATMGAGVAGLAFAAVVGHTATPGRWLALAICCLVLDTLTCATILLAVRLSGGKVGRRQLFDAAASLGLAVPANAAFAITTASAMSISPWGGLVSVLLVVGAVLLLRRQRDLEVKFSNLELLYAFSHSLTGITEATDVLTTTLESIKELLSCQDSEVLIKEGDEYVRICIHPNGALVNQTVPPDALERLVLDNGTGVVLAQGKGPRPLDDALAGRGWRDAVLVPLHGSDGLEGVMTAGQKLGVGNAFGPSDQRLLETFASHSIVALRGSNLLDRLRAEVAARSYEALHDALTGLGNRTLFRQRLDVVLREARGASMAVLMVDIDNFKEINDTLGHHTGDDVLRTAAERISDTVGTAGMACRIGGDEFAVILDSPTCEREALEVASAIREAVGRPLLAETMNFELQSAIGVAVAPDDGGDGNSLLRRADIAMYAAKTDKTAIERYDPARDPNTTRRLRLSGDLRRAIAAGEIQLWYQPKAELATGRIVGVEALARWRHERYGQVPPDEFVPLAEQSGSISALTWVVLEKAFAQKKEWERQDLTLDMAVNISARSLLDADLLVRLQELIDEYAVCPSGIILELTESSVMVDAERAEDVLEQIHELGIRISVDDFGTGYSSLSRLSRLSVAEIKIDKSFISSMLSSKTEAIVVATIELARNLGQMVTAEGVEDRATWDRLRELGCECVQGYYLSRPMPAAVATTWLVDMTRRHALRRPA